MSKATGEVTINGMVGDHPWTVTLPLDQASSAEGISKIWARRKIDDAEVEATLGSISQDAADARILRLALDHHLVTRLTSLVAVDVTPSRAANIPLTQADIPLHLPAGWDYRTLLGIGATRDASAGQSTESETAEWSGVNRQAKPQAAPSPVSPSLPLPQTATPATLLMLQGLLAVLVGALLFWFTRREKAGSHE
jgi:Ca-activated chloride channel family protein